MLACIDESRSRKPMTHPTVAVRPSPGLGGMVVLVLALSLLLFVAPHAGLAESTASSYPSGLTPSNGILFFAAADGDSGQQLWRSDGTAANTVLVKAVRRDVPNGFSTIENLTDAHGVLFFTATF